MLSLLLLSLAAWATAQDITLSVANKANNKGYQPTMILVDKADAEGRFYSVEPDVNAFSKLKGVLVREVDRDYAEIRRIEVPGAKGSSIYHVQRDGSTMHILLCNDEKRHYSMRHVAVDLPSFSIVADSMLVDAETSKKQYFLHWSSLSLSGDYFGYVYAFVDEKADRADLQAMLYDRGMRLQWSRPLPLTALSQVLATDDGRLATAGAFNGESKGEGALVEFSITTASGTQSGSYPSVSRLGEVTLLGVFGDRVLATALETKRGTGWAGSFTAGSVITIGNVYTGIASYLFDVAGGVMAGTDRHAFSKADTRVFYNASLVSEIASPEVNFLQARAKLATPGGGAVLLGRAWREKVMNTKTANSSNVYYYKGMMLFNIDSTGRIAWVRPIMHDNGTNADFGENTETDMVSSGDDIIVLTNESASDPDTYDPDNAARRTLLKVHGAISAYRFSADGQVTKNKLKTDGTNLICTPLRRQADGTYLFITRSTRGRIAELRLGR